MNNVIKGLNLIVALTTTWLVLRELNREKQLKDKIVEQAMNL